MSGAAAQSELGGLGAEGCSVASGVCARRTAGQGQQHMLADWPGGLLQVASCRDPAQSTYRMCIESWRCVALPR